MDAVPGEPETMITGGSMDGVLVLRSLTKTWGLAGLRAGYAVGDPTVITALARQQPPWSVSTPGGGSHDRLRVRDRPAPSPPPRPRRSPGVAIICWPGSTDLGLAVVPESRAPFVLVDSHGWLPGDHPRPGPCASACASAVSRSGAARRSPVSAPDWIRIAVRDEETTDTLIKTLRAIREEA